MSLNDASDMDPSIMLSDATLTALDLPQQPFGSLEANSASFSDETTAEQLGDIKQALVTGDDLLLILGNDGAGKSVMLKQLGEHSGLRIQCFAVKGSNRFSTMNLFAGLLEAFKQPPPEHLQDILDSLFPHLQSMISRNTLSVIVLDDAHLINEPELTQLLSSMLYVNSHDETVLRVAMAAPPEFEDRIPDLLPEGADLPYSSLTISGMTSFRAADFIEFRMREAGLRGDPPFSEHEVIELVENSGGLPGPLQIAAVDALNEQYGPVKRVLASDLETEKSGFLQSRFAKIALGILASLLIFLGILMFMPDKPNNESNRYTVSTTQPIDLSDEANDAAENDANGTSSPALPSSSASTAISSATNDERTDATAAVTEVPTSATSDTDNSVQTTEETTKEPIVIVATPSVDEDDTTEPTPTPSTTEINTAATSPTEPEKTASLESSSWILLQSRELYTVQMSASRDRQSVVNFLNAHADALDAPNSIYSFSRNGSDWYALLHGLYDSIDEARAAVEEMPPSALTNQPWIRSVARVQDVLKAQ